MKVLVVYYSRTGNTRFVAEKIAGKLKADIEEVIDKKSRGGTIGWLRAGIDATRRKETKIEETKHSASDYDLIVLGSPVWNKRIPPAMRTYINKNDLTKKKIAFFNTNYSDDTINTFPVMSELAKNQTPIAQLVVSKVQKNTSEAGKKAEDWCEQIIISLKPVKKRKRTTIPSDRD
jgi:flavodoxin